MQSSRRRGVQFWYLLKLDPTTTIYLLRPRSSRQLSGVNRFFIAPFLVIPGLQQAVQIFHLALSRFHVLLQTGPSFSCLACSVVAIWSFNFMSCILTLPRDFDGPSFSGRAFSVDPLRLCRSYNKIMKTRCYESLTFFIVLFSLWWKCL